VEFKFERSRLNFRSFYEPYSDTITVNGKYSQEEIERLIELELMHEVLHSTILRIEGYFTSLDMDKSKVVEILHEYAKNEY
jgi:hypothetical protein